MQTMVAEVPEPDPKRDKILKRLAQTLRQMRARQLSFDRPNEPHKDDL